MNKTTAFELAFAISAATAHAETLKGNRTKGRVVSTSKEASIQEQLKGCEPGEMTIFVEQNPLKGWRIEIRRFVNEDSENLTFESFNRSNITDAIDVGMAIAEINSGIGNWK